ncbi:hypothetical protein YB2330_000267 [Saitoella coloradoensis]
MPAPEAQLSVVQETTPDTSNTVARPAAECYNIPSIQIKELFFDLPLDYGHPEKETIRVFARHCLSLDKLKDAETLPYIVYLQGGPGFECAQPSNTGVTKVLLNDYQILYLDQRGTGLSTPISAGTLEKRGSDEAKADYLKHFRADNIVRDCERIREKLLGEHEEARWSILGQSFGGFCCLTYLSQSPHGLRECFITGGLPPILEGTPDNVYKSLYKKLQNRNDMYYEKYPMDVARVRSIVKYLGNKGVRLPNDGQLTARRFLQLGLEFGLHGGFDKIHDLVFRAANDLQTFRCFTYRTLTDIQNMQSFDTNPLYAILHEVIYCQAAAPSWSAERTLSLYPIFQWGQQIEEGDDARIYFTGEMIFRWMFEDYAELKPLAKVADMLAEYDQWPRLYDPERLAKNTVPVVAVSYVDDMYVDLQSSIDTACRIGNCKQWQTNRYLHNGIRHAPNDVLPYLFSLARGDVDI